MEFAGNDNLYQLRPAVAADIPVIVELDRTHMKAAVDRHYPGEWDEDALLSVISDNIGRARVAEHNRHVVAFYYWYMEDGSEAVLHSVQVMSVHRGRGLGHWLILCFESDAKAAGATRACLTVFVDNPAVVLYKRLGYKITGTDGPYALEMGKSL